MSWEEEEEEEEGGKANILSASVWSGWIKEYTWTVNNQLKFQELFTMRMSFICIVQNYRCEYVDSKNTKKKKLYLEHL